MIALVVSIDLDMFTNKMLKKSDINHRLDGLINNFSSTSSGFCPEHNIRR
jgi:hypothetical protein